jgi:spermidine synthase
MRAVVLACFFLSGASALVLEMLWTRMLTLVFGSTTLAVSTVLTAYMGGLGLGSYLAGRVADRLRDPVRAYAAAEAAVGVYALLVPWVIGFYPALNTWLWTTFGDRYALLSTLRFVASAGLLLLPTTLMGATLPLLARYFVSRPQEFGEASGQLGRLYAVNLFGAVTGSFLAGFVFLPTIGVRATNVVAAGFNLTLAAGILTVRRLRARRAGLEGTALPEAGGETAAGPPLTEAPAPLVFTSAARRAVLFGFALSGATAMTLQVLWTRALAVVLGSSIFSFTIILLAFLVGLGIGSAAFARLCDRTRRPILLLGLVHLGIAICIGISYLLADKLPFLFTWLLSSTTFNVDAVLVCQFVLACVSLLPATILMGAIFPITIKIVTADVRSVGRDVGSAYAINTLGAITGSFLSGFVVLPQLGLQKGIYVAVCAGLGLAAVLFLVAPGLPTGRRIAGAGAAVALALGGLALPRWNLVSFSVGFFRVSLAKDYLERTSRKQTWATPKLVYYEDGVATTVSVDQWGKVYSMKNNGKVDASNDADMPTQISVGLLPMLLYPHDEATRPPKVALVGYGSGVTAGSITQFPIASLEIVELEPAIYRASRFFEDVNHRPLDNPKVTARVGDGRNFLGQRTDRFDVIVSQPSNPWITGVSNLFTREYFQSVKARLADGGIFCQWAQLYEMAPWNIKTIYRTLKDEFPHVLVFAAEDLSSDTILIASERPLPIDVRRIAARLEHAATAKEARRAGWTSAHDIPAYLLLTSEELEAFTAGAVPNTDDNARIEFQAPRDLLGFAKYDPYLAKVYGPAWPYGRLSEIVRGYDGPGASAAMGLLGRSLLAHGKRREAELWTRRAEEAGGGPEAAHARLLLDLVATREDRDPEIALVAEGEALEPPAPPAGTDPALAERIRREYREIDALVAGRKYASAFKVVEAWPETVWGKLGKDFTLLSGFLSYKTEFYGDAIDELAPLAEDPAYVARHPEVLYYLGRSYFANLNYTKAVSALERFVEAQRARGGPLLPRGAERRTPPAERRTPPAERRTPPEPANGDPRDR